MKTIERFLRKVHKSRCWVWKTNKKSVYYWKFWLNGRMQGAHRVSWILHKGPIPKGKLVLHDCPGGDNKACVRPSHLWLGSHSDNEYDAVKKGRKSPSGEAHHSAKLNWRKVFKIRKSKDSQRALAREYGVCQAVINEVVRNRIWRKQNVNK